jgi:hypothetical protein
MKSTAFTTREFKAGKEDRFYGVGFAVRRRGAGKIRLCFYSLSAAASGGNLINSKGRHP